ncbi:MAG: hypothetical protein VX929_04325 [Pseudomonadota bacterium]|nr:hypothetical protein [Pseudomonadota bacterium]
MNRKDSSTQLRDHFWWVHPAFRAEQTLELGDAGVMPEGSMLWRKFGERHDEEDRRGLPADGGPYAILAKLLFKLNHYRPGPVDGWYVVVCIESGQRWAVGQLRADAARPVQVFADLIFGSEAEAREKAQTMRAREPSAPGS